MKNNKRNGSQHSKTSNNFKKDQKNSEVIEKQLNDDFQVHEYLNENKLEGYFSIYHRNNIEEYIRLHDSMLVTKSSKKKALDHLGFHKSKLKTMNEQDKSLKETSDEDLQIMKENFQREYSKTQILTMNELQIKKNLWRQIIESKKSLSLLKGDIGHLVGRNESANLLESKITKVKIVADDQIKRVSMAFGKDKEEIKIRNEMQKNFHNKLRNISITQDKNLDNLKKVYIESVQKKKNLFERLNQIQKISASIDEYDDLDKQKNVKNYKSIQMHKSLTHLVTLIESDPLQEIINFRTEEVEDRVQRSNFLTNECFEAMENCIEVITNDYDPFDENDRYTSENTKHITYQALREIESAIVTEYFRVNYELSKICKVYEEKIRNVKELQKESDKLESDACVSDQNAQNKRWSSFESKQEMLGYFQKLKILGQSIKTILKVLVYLQKNFPGLIKKNYISNLFNVYHELLNIDVEKEPTQDQKFILQEIEGIGKTIHPELHHDLTVWHNIYADKNLKSVFMLSRSKPCKKAIPIRHDINQTQFESQITTPNRNRDTKANELDCQDDQALSESNISVQRKAIHSIKSQKSKKQDKTNQYYNGDSKKDCVVKAQRIQLLEDIDQNYYKMLKNTLKMEKQNTRKNYDFLRSFKRAKYANRDEILDQKRFESSFSVLLTNNDAKPKISPKKSVHISTKKLTSRIKPLTANSNSLSKKSVKTIRIKQGKVHKMKLSQKLRSLLNEI